LPTDDPIPDHLLLDEAAARRLLLVEAVDSVDREGRLVGLVERERIDQDALTVTGDPAVGQRLDPKAWLLARADRFLDLLAHRQPRLAALATPPAWQPWVGWLLPLAALVLGGFIDRIDNPRQVNLLSPPLLAFLLWNMVVYLGLLAVALRPRRPSDAPPPAWLPWLQRIGAGRTGALRADVVRAFGVRWWQVAGALEGQRWRRILHTSAAAWAIGVALSIVVGGLVREYRVGWESTLLDLPQVHAFLRVLFAPVVALLPLEPFTQQELARLHFGSGLPVDRLEARRWVGLYLGLLAVVVIAPRALLAAWAAWRQRQLARRVRIALDSSYFSAVLGRVSPARVRLVLVTVGDADARVLRQVLRQAGGEPSAQGLARTVLTTLRGDALVCREATLDALLADWTAGPSGPRWLPRFGRRSEAAQGEEADLLLVSGDRAADLESALPALQTLGRPVLLLPAMGSEAGLERALRANGVRGDVLAQASLATWHGDARLRAAMARLLPPYLAPGVERLVSAWQRHADHRLEQAARLLADELVDAARESQPLALLPLGVRQLVVRGEREAGQEARREAMAALLARLRERQQAVDARLLALHAAVRRGGGLVGDAWPDRFRVHQAVHEPQAGLAGAASGAAMGATVDLLTGGLTLGAASALGALVGGGAALAAAAWKNRAAEAGSSLVMVDEAQWLALVELALVRYLAAAHAGRSDVLGAGGWEGAVHDVVEPHRAALRDLLRLARPGAVAGAGEVRALLAEQLRQRALDLLAQLHGSPRG
jgi:hypothetical protein